MNFACIRCKKHPLSGDKKGEVRRGGKITLSSQEGDITIDRERERIE
jgi:hypothetical protein